MEDTTPIGTMVDSQIEVTEPFDTKQNENKHQQEAAIMCTQTTFAEPAPKAKLSSSFRLGLKLSKPSRKRSVDSMSNRRLSIQEASAISSTLEATTTGPDDASTLQDNDVRIEKSQEASRGPRPPEKSLLDPVQPTRHHEWSQTKLSVPHDAAPMFVPEPTTTQSYKNKRSTKNNDNFVRQNLRNSAGACRGARNKKKFRRGGRFQKYRKEDDDTKERKEKPNSSTGQQYASRMTGLDPLDEFLDGVFDPKKKKKQEESNNNKKMKQPQEQKKPQKEQQAPQCARHQRPCKLLVVKKNTTGNKGRKFFACSMPRGEQCNHFQWAEDTVEVTRTMLCFVCYFMVFFCAHLIAWLSFPP
jgi:hypothetical protein